MGLSLILVVVVVNKVSDIIFKTIYFHHYIQGESFVCSGGGAVGSFWVEQLFRSKSYYCELIPDENEYFKTNYAIYKVVVLRWFMYIFMSTCPGNFPMPVCIETLKPKYLLK